jgi:hypothetical protein
MEKEPATDRPDDNVPIDDLGADQEGANPAHPVPPSNAGSDSIAGKAEADEQIEDRFEATDN